MYYQAGLDLSMIPEFSETLLFLPLVETSFLGITNIQNNLKHEHK